MLQTITNDVIKYIWFCATNDSIWNKTTLSYLAQRDMFL